jgi:SAM-dependent methyltransferase
VSAVELLKLPDDELIELMEQFELSRYGGWRNTQNRWRKMLGLDTTHDKDVLDYGCGTGIEALQYAKQRNRVLVADIAPENALLAKHVLAVFGYESALHVIFESRPRLPLVKPESIDVIHCCGVLHHIEDAEDVVEEMAGWLRHDGELRLMVYSDVSWRKATNTHPPENVRQHPAFRTYVRAMDAVGEYADWYDCTRLQRCFGEWFTVSRCDYLDSTLGYLGAVLRRNT